MGQSSVNFDRQLTSLFDAYVKYAGAFSQRGVPQDLIDVGPRTNQARISNSIFIVSSDSFRPARQTLSASGLCQVPGI